MTNFLKDKVAIITGSNRGIGRAILETFAEHGCRAIFACARRETEEFILNVRQLEEKYGTRIIPIYFDLEKQEEIAGAAKQIRAEKEFMPDILVNCAGVLSEYRRFTMMPAAESKRLFDIDFWGQMEFTQLISRQMQRRRNGNIIFISSIAGMDGFFSSYDYVACKAAINGAVKQLAREFGELNIRVNAIAPGLVETDMIKDNNAENLESIKPAIMLRRFGTKEEIANAVMFLASDYASYITGQIIRVDGGTTPPRANW